MATSAEREKIQEILSRDEYRSNLAGRNFPLGLRILNQSNKIVTASTFFYVLATRSLASAYFGLGAIGCMVFAKILKEILREKRPVGTTYKITYGMPSTHSATISYYATFIALAATRLPVHPSLSSVPPKFINPIAPVLMTVTSLVICISRIRLGHHTLKQVGAGITVGTLFGLGWFAWWSTGGAQDIAWGVVEYLPSFLRSYIR